MHLDLLCFEKMRILVDCMLPIKKILQFSQYMTLISITMLKFNNIILAIILIECIIVFHYL